MRVNRPGVGGGSYQAARSGLGHGTLFARRLNRLARFYWPWVQTFAPVLLALVHAFAPVPWRWVQTFTQYLGVGFKRLPRSSWHGFKHLAKPCRSRLAGEPGYLVNAAVPAEMRSPASLFLQVWVGANAGEPCWLL